MAGKGQFLLQTPTGIQDVTPQVTRFVYRRSLWGGCVRWKLWFASGNWNAWKDIVIGNGLVLSAKIKSSFGSVTTESDWLKLVVDSSAESIQGMFVRGSIVGGSADLKMKEQQKRRSFPQATAAQVIQRIATEYQLIPDVGASSGIRDWWQTNQTDWEMLQEAMDY